MSEQQGRRIASAAGDVLASLAELEQEVRRGGHSNRLGYASELGEMYRRVLDIAEKVEG